MKVLSHLVITITNNQVNFKLNFPSGFLDLIEITEDERKVKIYLENNKIIIKKANSLTFKELTKYEKQIQIQKKYSISKEKYDKQEELIDEIANYFNINSRTVYVYLKNKIDSNELESVQLISKQNNSYRNLNVMFTNVNDTIKSVLTIPTVYAVEFLKSKNYKELKIKSALEIYNSNTKIPIKMKYIRADKCIEISKVK